MSCSHFGGRFEVRRSDEGLAQKTQESSESPKSRYGATIIHLINRSEMHDLTRILITRIATRGRLMPLRYSQAGRAKRNKNSSNCSERWNRQNLFFWRNLLDFWMLRESLSPSER